MSKKSKQNKVIGGVVGFVVIVIAILFSFFVAPKMFATEYQNGVIATFNENLKDKLLPDSKPKTDHVKTPEIVRAIYMTACVAGTPSFRDKLVDLIDNTEVNSIVIDIKDFSGTISFNTDNPDLVGVNGTGCRSNDLPEFIKTLHEKGIYVIGRITVFQDPYYTKLHPELAVKKDSDKTANWKDYKGLSFIEVGAKTYWDYIVTLAEESHSIGFDELNFDYVRFPSDGNMKDIYYPFSQELIDQDPDNGKATALEGFFKYLSEQIAEYNKEEDYPMITSVDLFGMTTTNDDDLNIGQILERALPYFDYVAPMIYPSHYPDNFNGWADPNKYPYDLIHFVLLGGIEKIDALDSATTTPAIVRDHVYKKQLRPWIQDFDYGGNYDIPEVKAQLQATYDVGLDSWMLWAPSNRYTVGALAKEIDMDNIDTAENGSSEE